LRVKYRAGRCCSGGRRHHRAGAAAGVLSLTRGRRVVQTAPADSDMRQKAPMDSPARQRQCDAFARLDAIMEIGAAVPSERAAAAVIAMAAARVSRVAIAHHRRSDVRGEGLAKVAASAKKSKQARRPRQVRCAHLKGHTRHISLQRTTASPLHFTSVTPRGSARLRLVLDPHSLIPSPRQLHF
jgi:hypothetical protein